MWPELRQLIRERSHPEASEVCDAQVEHGDAVLGVSEAISHQQAIGRHVVALAEYADVDLDPVQRNHVSVHVHDGHLDPERLVPVDVVRRNAEDKMVRLRRRGWRWWRRWRRRWWWRRWWWRWRRSHGRGREDHRASP